ncbi:MAG: hypothetical protein COZ49_02925 [Candidatus Yonathbacteria bacterium CG_4_10_14_3_um_filter_47_65]|uniref:CxxC-x17-CxxC domain-containing protein n=2 Tax=Parcubacteria group TaxID=1794811 RepID=A0A2M8D6N7_9BACT|nr:MAG: hypothetical protein AUJ44_04330 [Candidatus Nomurabacteria bacterium CG1_02_47_685]PIP03669.1 MAG: hypothetical protein COX54_02755 [Candidatus Yonathbacteria bacterium CG23_combo_of_CG06-09_8_20_14_all_46_18]PIQ31723.1 MAG: hypothetical protein COW61_03310 [Candidatus Yonathbacteria bacterium CG17_big_fil_post_rev_8_21_14_2_50_46_19]PIX56280.1 MAG: hypothetical protein COZ49_02925 [Candidatus Yonathbacteria bacterium CG_4_10_14_3_um_filter_47_65]PIY57941.1 MAG: hypothetical protein CO
MGNFDNKGKRFADNRSGKKFGERSFSGNQGRDRRLGGRKDGYRAEMHKAVCSNCGKSCEVPFRPTGEKPIFCSDCFRAKTNAGGQDSRGGDNRGFGEKNPRSHFDDGRSYGHTGEKDITYHKMQFNVLNVKLDKILKILTPVVSAGETEIRAPEFKKLVKSPKKKIDVVALKKVLTKAVGKKAVSKETLAKKAVVKKKKK